MKKSTLSPPQWRFSYSTDTSRKTPRNTKVATPDWPPQLSPPRSPLIARNYKYIEKIRSLAIGPHEFETEKDRSVLRSSKNLTDDTIAICTFFASFHDTSLLSPDRKRRSFPQVEIRFYTEDNSIEILSLNNPSSLHFGAPRSQVLHRHQVNKPTPSGTISPSHIFTLKDFFIGAPLLIYDKVSL